MTCGIRHQHFQVGPYVQARDQRLGRLLEFRQITLRIFAVAHLNRKKVTPVWFAPVAAVRAGRNTGSAPESKATVTMTRRSPERISGPWVSPGRRSDSWHQEVLGIQQLGPQVQTDTALVSGSKDFDAERPAVNRWMRRFRAEAVMIISFRCLRIEARARHCLNGSGSLQMFQSERTLVFNGAFFARFL